MRSRALLVVSFAWLALAAPAQAKVSCSSGATIMREGGLRVFAVRVHTKLDIGWSEWACLGRSAAPLRVSYDTDAVQGDGGIETHEYAFAGGRYLAVASINIGENGGDGAYDVWDLRTRRHVKWFPASWDFNAAPNMWVSPHGDVVATDDIDDLGLFPLHGRRQTLARDARALALAGTTAYWTEGGVAHSATLAGPASSAPDERLVSVGFGRATRCEQRPGTTVFHSGVMRVARHRGKLFACRLFHRPVLPLPSHLAPATLRVAHDRWLFGVDPCSHAASVFDLRYGRTVTELPFKTRWPATLLNDGTLAWIDDAATLFAQAPDIQEATTLATEASALASTGKTVYWTAGGAAHSWTAPPPKIVPSAGTFAGCA
jgi:hypothetical protein